MATLFFTKGDKTVASSRQRIWFLAEKLQAVYGHEYTVLHSMAYPVWSLSRARWQAIRDSYRKLTDSRYSVVFVHKSFFPADIVCLIVAAKFFFRKKLVYDLDDAEWVHSPFKTKFFVRFADTVICGSEVIRAWAAKRTSRVVYIPTVVDHELYARYRIEHEVRSRYTIGWTGVGMRHFKDGHFHMVKPALQALTASGIKFRFVILGAQGCQPLKNFFSDASFEVVYIDTLDWTDPASVPRAIHEYTFDIGLMPQNDTPFNRAKCSFKAIEYMACGVPVIVSPVGENLVIIKNGVNGFHASNTVEWIDTMKKLLGDAELRTRIGQLALGTVRERYSYEVIIPKIKEQVI